MLFGLPFVTAYICQKDTPITQIITWDKMPAGYIHGFQLEETSTMAKDQHSGKLRFYTTERLTRDLTSCVRKEGISLRFYSGGSREELLFAADVLMQDPDVEDMSSHDILTDWRFVTWPWHTRAGKSKPRSISRG